MTYMPTQQDVANIMEHVRYEISHCFNPPEHDKSDLYVHECVYLAKLIHARQLIKFFGTEKEKRPATDVLCADFNFPVSDVNVAKGDIDRLNRDIAHLTYYRLRHRGAPADKPWPIDRILAPLKGRCAAFVQHVVDNPPSGADPQELAAWRELGEAFQSSSSITVVQAMTTTNTAHVPPIFLHRRDI
jgi:hypothetical protein